MKTNKNKGHLITSLTITFSLLLASASFAQQTKKQEKFEGHKFHALPYAYNALEPYIDAQTMEIHYSKHHKAYYDNFMKAAGEAGIDQLSLSTIFSTMSQYSTFIRNNGGGYYNHNLFWENLSPVPSKLSQELEKAIVSKFGSMDTFKEEFSKAGASQFGSGWAWLILTDDKQLQITATANQDNPLMDVAGVKGTPLLALDVWEHAYYLKYQNKRADYIKAFWNVVNWKVVSDRYSAAMKGK
jgi:Fe-Mn family superoxide dismutase